MKRLAIIIFGLTLILNSCNNISNKTVSEKLETEELSKAIKSDTMFSDFYEEIRKEVDQMDDIKKAKFNDVTYRRLFNFFKFSNDTAYWHPLNNKWEKEWENDFGFYMAKADSTIAYWKTYLIDNSLDKYVQIELVRINKEYYDYIGEIKEVNLGFSLTPLQGPIEQIRFNYGYQAKIHGDKYYNKHKCIETDPLNAPRIDYWEVDYSDKAKFAGKSVETFMRDYYMHIEVTEIRKDGVNISTADFAVPDEVRKCIEVENDYPSLYEHYKADIIKNLINYKYVGMWEYRNKKADQIKEKEDKLCFDFTNELYK